MPEIKFCGLTRAEDAAEAGRLGARYAGVIFAGGPRRLTPDRAALVLRAVSPTMRRVGVFAGDAHDDVARVAREVDLDVVQLHGDPEPRAVDELRGWFPGEIWAVVRTADATLPPRLADLFVAADAVVLDAKVAGALGGTGVTLPWAALAEAVGAARGASGRLVVAGGLVPQNVAAAVAALAPDVVDVSSGVESAPGVKDHERMRAFAAAARGASPRSTPRSING